MPRTGSGAAPRTVLTDRPTSVGRNGRCDPLGGRRRRPGLRAGHVLDVVASVVDGDAADGTAQLACVPEHGMEGDDRGAYDERERDDESNEHRDAKCS